MLSLLPSHPNLGIATPGRVLTRKKNPNSQIKIRSVEAEVPMYFLKLRGYLQALMKNDPSS